MRTQPEVGDSGEEGGGLEEGPSGQEPAAPANQGPMDLTTWWGASSGGWEGLKGNKPQVCLRGACCQIETHQRTPCDNSSQMGQQVSRWPGEVSIWLGLGGAA